MCMTHSAFFQSKYWVKQNSNEFYSVVRTVSMLAHSFLFLQYLVIFYTLFSHSLLLPIPFLLLQPHVLKTALFFLPSYFLSLDVIFFLVLIFWKNQLKKADVLETHRNSKHAVEQILRSCHPLVSICQVFIFGSTSE